MITYCVECKFVYRVNQRDLPRYWLCTRHKRSDREMGYILREFWNDEPPYLYCRDVNAGHCPLFEEADPNQVNQLTGNMEGK